MNKTIVSNQAFFYTRSEIHELDLKIHINSLMKNRHLPQFQINGHIRPFLGYFFKKLIENSFTQTRSP